MGVFAEDKRFGRRTFKIILASFRGSIHRAPDIGMTSPVSPLVLDRTTAVIRLDPVIYFLEIGTVSSLISHTPDDDGRMVIVTVNHTLVTHEVHIEEVLTRRQSFFTVTHSV